MSKSQQSTSESPNREAWLNVWQLADAVILGQRVKPLTCFHAAILHATASPFIGAAPPGERCTRSELVFALWVCSRPRETVLRCMAKDKALTAEMRKARLWGLKQRKADWREEGSAFVAHLGRSMTCPEFWSPEGAGGRHSGIPWPWKLVCVVAQHYPSLTIDALWDMPVAMAACYRAHIAEESGQIAVSEDEAAIVARAEAAGVAFHG